MSYFHEEQRFAKSWGWLLLIVVAVAVAGLGAAVFATPPVSPAALAAALTAVAVTFVVLFVARLTTDVSGEEIVIAFHGIWPTRRVPLDEVVGHAARTYSILDSGGWGVHWGLAGMTYNVTGNRGVQLRLRNGKRVLIGSQRAEELDAAIAKAIASRG